MHIRIGGEWLTSRPGRSYPRNEQQYPLNSRLEGPTAGVDVLEKREIPCHCRGSSPGPATRSTVAILTTLPQISHTSA